jgi:hypothetical protein
MGIIIWESGRESILITGAWAVTPKEENKMNRMNEIEVRTFFLPTL